MKRAMVALVLVVVACSMLPRPEFRPTAIANDEAVEAWLADGQPVTLTHSYEDDQVDISIEISRSDSVHVACSVWVENRSQHDTVIDFKSTTIEDEEKFRWVLSGSAFSLEDNEWSEEWRVGPGEAKMFSAVYENLESAKRSPTRLIVELSGLIGPYELTDQFSFTRIDWP